MLLFLDYDETLTAHDTLSLIPPPFPSSSSSTRALRQHHHHHHHQEEEEEEEEEAAQRSDPPRDFPSCARAYLSDLASHERSWPAARRCTVREEMRFLASLADVERKSVERVEDAALFLGWDPQEARQRARTRVRFRRGVLGSGEEEQEQEEQEEERSSDDSQPSLRSFLHAHSSSCSSSSSSLSSSSSSPSSPRSVTAGILSVSWSCAFIRASLEPPFRLDRALAFVHANDPVLDSVTGLGTGQLNKGDLRGGIRTGLDKLRLMREEVASRSRGARAQPQQAQQGSRHEGLVGRSTYSVYAGDSNTDLPCLLEASLGLILGEATSLLATLQRLALRDRVVDGYQGLHRKTRQGKFSLRPIDPDRIRPWSEEEEFRAEEVCLVRVRDWIEGVRVLEWVLGLEEGVSVAGRRGTEM